MGLQQDNTRIRTEIQQLKDANKDLKVCRWSKAVHSLEPSYLLTTMLCWFNAQENGLYFLLQSLP